MQTGRQEVKANSAMRGGEDFLTFGSVAPSNVWFGIYSSSLWKKMDFSSRYICKSLGSYLFDLLPQMLHSLFTENEYFFSS